MAKNNIKNETIINIYTVEKGELKILLERKKTEPYKGYWILPGNEITEEETLEENIKTILEEKIGTSYIYIEQHHTYSEINRKPDERVIATSFIGIVDSKTLEIKKENIKENDLQWFSIDEIPKMAYDHKEIQKGSQELLKTKIINTNILKNLFPSDFSLPELQSIYEKIMNIELDRRNFRKKFITLGLIEDTGYKSEGGSGRPAKLYKFKENIKEINLF